MTLFFLFLLFANPVPASLDQVKAEPNMERRARAAVDFAIASEKAAETAYAGGDLDATVAKLKTMQESMELAKTTLDASGKTPGRNGGVYKYGEQKSQELLLRLRDLEQRMDDEERQSMTAMKNKVQEIHDDWFEGIMERRK